MILKWGRKGLIGAAFAFTFVTPVSALTSVKQVQQPDTYGRLEYRHITPVSVTAGIKRVQQPDTYGRFKYRHLTPVEVVEEIEEAPTGGSGYPFYVIHEDEELIERLRLAEIERLADELKEVKEEPKTLALVSKKQVSEVQLRAGISRLQGLLAEARQREAYELFRAKTARDTMLERLRLQEDEALALILIMSECT